MNRDVKDTAPKRRENDSTRVRLTPGNWIALVSLSVTMLSGAVASGIFVGDHRYMPRSEIEDLEIRAEKRARVVVSAKTDINRQRIDAHTAELVLLKDSVSKLRESTIINREALKRIDALHADVRELMKAQGIGPRK